ncbi:F-box protein SKIP23 [Citrus sinensis]|uniref:F-box protein SKIP23 n=1 Tax=Citrus sinensis TaxID=2711 RepID=A0ACB8P2U1_CITSI|nr:F-box protein SKIP23 [Citrus sinensis]
MSARKKPQLSDSVSSWADLPKELLLLIAKLLDTDDDHRHHINLRRFRAVCPQWRNAASTLPIKSPPLLPMNLRFPITLFSNTSFFPFTLYQTTVYRIEEPGSSPKNSWLIKVSEQVNGRSRLMNPFSSLPIKYLLDNRLPKQVNLLNFRFSEVCNRFYLRPNSGTAGFDDPDIMPCFKAALPSDFRSSDDHQRFLVIDQDGELRCPRDRAHFWRRIERDSGFVDVDTYKNKFYAIELNGKVRVFEELSSSSLDVSACSVRLSQPNDRLCTCGECHSVEYTWDPVTDLGDQIFFISRDCSFAVSSQDFANCGGNCIIFVDDPIYRNNHWHFRIADEPAGLAERRVGIYDLHLGVLIRPLKLIPRYFNMFWPPPAWLSSNHQCCSMNYYWLTNYMNAVKMQAANISYFRPDLLLTEMKLPEM